MPLETQPATRPIAGSRKKGRSALWLAVHGWLGLPIWAFLSFICLTGSIATVSQEIMWLIEPATRANQPAPGAGPMSYDAIVRRIEEQAPGSWIMFIDIPVKRQYALEVYVGRQEGGTRTLYVNPYTGAIQGQRTAFDLREFLRELHGWLLIPFTTGYSPGWYIVSAMSIPLLGSLVSGLFVYKKFWRAILKPRLRLRQGARVFWGDLHRLFGLWSVPFIAIIGVSAFWFLLEACLSDSGQAIPGEEEPPTIERQEVGIGADRQSVPRIPLQQAIDIARRQFTVFTPAYIELPETAYQALTVAGRGTYPLVFEIAYINPYSGELIGTRHIASRSAYALAAESMRPLHTGDFAGLWLKLVYCFFGLLLTTMSLSGMLIWTKRSAQASAKYLKARRRAVPDQALPRAVE